MTFAPAIEALERELATVEARAASIREAIAFLRGDDIGTAETVGTPVGNRAARVAYTGAGRDAVEGWHGPGEPEDLRTDGAAETGDAGTALVDAWAPREADLYGEDGRDLTATNADVEDAEPHLQKAQRLGTSAAAERQRQIGRENDDLVLSAIRAEGERATMEALSTRTGLAPLSVKRVLQRLKAAGRLRMEGWARGRRLIVVDNGDATPASEPEPDRAAPRPSSDASRNAPKRRFTDHPQLDPERVHGLADGHPALIEARTLFPSTVVDPRTSPRVLVSGANSRKIGDRVTKGPWKGMPIYTLTLEERATCPATCHHWSTCFGNGMQFARRHRHGPELEQQLETELFILNREHPAGFVVRLHVLGDFYSVDYVNRWENWLVRFHALRVFGYTAWPEITDIGRAVHRLREAIWERFAIRTSREPVEIVGPVRPTATTLRRVAEGRQPEGIVCPAQSHPGVCCGSCGLCWSPHLKTTPIAFMLHGRKSAEAPEPIAAKRTTPEPQEAAAPGQETAPADTTTAAEAPPAEPAIEAPARPGPKSTPDPQPAAVHRPAPATREKRRKAASPKPVKVTPAAPAPAPAPAPANSPARRGKPSFRSSTPKLYTPPGQAKPGREHETDAIRAFLDRKGERKIEAGTMDEVLERTFKLSGKSFRKWMQNSPEARAKPYVLDGVRLTLAEAIDKADRIRASRGLPALGVTHTAAAE